MRSRFVLPLLLAAAVVFTTIGCGGSDTKKVDASNDTSPKLKERPAPGVGGGPPADAPKTGGKTTGNAAGVQ